MNSFLIIKKLKNNPNHLRYSSTIFSQMNCQQLLNHFKEIYDKNESAKAKLDKCYSEVGDNETKTYYYCSKWIDFPNKEDVKIASSVLELFSPMCDKMNLNEAKNS